MLPNCAVLRSAHCCSDPSTPCPCAPMASATSRVQYTAVTTRTICTDTRTHTCTHASSLHSLWPQQDLHACVPSCTCRLYSSGCGSSWAGSTRFISVLLPTPLHCPLPSSFAVCACACTCVCVCVCVAHLSRPCEHPVLPASLRVRAHTLSTHIPQRLHHTRLHLNQPLFNGSVGLLGLDAGLKRDELTLH